MIRFIISCLLLVWNYVKYWAAIIPRQGWERGLISKCSWLFQFLLGYRLYQFSFPISFIILLIWKFFTPALADCFLLESNIKSPQISRTLLSTHADFNNAVVWTVSVHPLFSKSSSLCTNPLVTVPNSPNTISVTVTFMFHSFFSSLARSSYLSLFSLPFNFTLWSVRTAKSTIREVLFFLLTITRSGLLAEIKWSVCISKSQRIICASHFLGQILGCAYTISQPSRV